MQMQREQNSRRSFNKLVHQAMIHRWFKFELMDKMDENSASCEDESGVQKAPSEKPCVICCEILDSRTKNTILLNQRVAQEAEYVLSHTTVAKVISMVSMRREIKGVLEELLGEYGQSLFVLPAKRYAKSKEWLSFWDLSQKVRQNGDILIGYQLVSQNQALSLNPPKKHTPIEWAGTDCLIVVCKDDDVYRKSDRDLDSRLPRPRYRKTESDRYIHCRPNRKSTLSMIVSGEEDGENGCDI
uniref:Uncharacterized protein n=1 Tax=Octactis speculum TaxID=3111310 RepID=A0A7S2AUW4_9STRA|mmetsp:Transcript_16052/g.21622  ORF Transcript_16052/g.21622 Transcript_16052/m.21622 type:complete len:242 (+) Transcript_16052:91-816(+)